MTELREIRAADTESIVAFLVERWRDRIIMLDGRAIDAANLPGFVKFSGDAIVGLITLLDDASGSEIVTLDSVVSGSGLGTELIERAVRRAAALKLTRLVVRTTNDNLDALRFYQRRGFRLQRLAPGAIDAERKIKPSIPLTGHHGIPIRDEITLVRRIDWP